jgi:hypothetical protein
LSVEKINTYQAGFRIGTPAFFYKNNPATMDKTEQKIIDTSLAQLKSVHENMGRLWDAETMATFYYRVVSGTIARNGPEVAQALSSMLSEVFDSAAKANASLGGLTNGFPNSGKATSDEDSAMKSPKK